MLLLGTFLSLCSIKFLLVSADPVCLETLGQNISPTDCIDALNDLRHTSIMGDFDRQIPRRYTFGTGQTIGGRFRVPQGEPPLHFASGPGRSFHDNARISP